MTTRFSALRTYIPSRRSEDSDDPFTPPRKTTPQLCKCVGTGFFSGRSSLVLQVDYQGNIISASTILLRAITFLGKMERFWSRIRWSLGEIRIFKVNAMNLIHTCSVIPDELEYITAQYRAQGSIIHMIIYLVWVLVLFNLKTPYDNLNHQRQRW